MLSKKVACLSLAATVCISGTTNVVSAMELGTAQKQSSSIEFNRIVENPKDFKEKEKEAKEYGKKLPNHREKIVTTKKEKEAFNNYELNGTRINQALREGKVDGYPNEYVEIAKEYAAEMDKVFKKREAATPDAIKVYRYTDEKQFGFERDTFFPNGSVNKEAIESLKKQIEGKNVKDKGFTSTSLAILDKYLGEQKKTIRMDIVIPKGSRTVYMDNDYAEMDDFNSHPITLNKQQVDQLLNNKPMMLETNQTDGVYKIKDTGGNLVTGGEWNGVTQQVEAKTASIIVDDGKRVAEKRVAAKDYNYPEDKTPSLTLKDALKLSYPDQIKEVDGLLYFDEQPIYEASVMTYLDENTAKEVKKQINDTTGKFKDVNKLYDVKLTPKMNFTLKMATLYDDAEQGENIEPLGHWYYTYNVVGGNTGKRQYRSAHPSASVALSSEMKKKLNKNTNYYLSMYMKADSNTEPTIEVTGEKSAITSKKVKLNNQGYQRVDILIKNFERNPIDKIYIRGNDTTNVYWDDIAISEVSAISPASLSDQEIKEIYKDYTEQIVDWSNGKYLDNVTFKNIKPLQNYVKKYRVEYTRFGHPEDTINQVRDSREVNANGSVQVNMLDYNKGHGINVGFWGGGYAVTIFAVTDDGREIPVYDIGSK